MEEEKKELARLEAIKAMGITLGGKTLVADIAMYCVTAIDQIASNYKTLSHAEMIGWAATLGANLELHRNITLVDKRIDQLKQLIEAPPEG